MSTPLLVVLIIVGLITGWVIVDLVSGGPHRRLMRRVDRIEAKLQLPCGCRLPHAPSLRARPEFIQTLDCTQGHRYGGLR